MSKISYFIVRTFDFNQFRFRKEVLYFINHMSFEGFALSPHRPLPWTRWGPRRTPEQLMQHYVIKFVCDFRQIGGYLLIATI
jgi:hypothetical protein